MPAAFVKSLTTLVSNKTAGTTLDGTTNTSVTAGNLIVACFVFDNAATASKPVVSSISKPAGETANWLFLGAARSTSTSAGAFASGEMWCIKTTVGWAAGTTITLTLDTSVTMKAADYSEFSGTLATLRSTVGTAYSTTTTAASATTTGTTPAIDDLAVGLTFQSNSATTPSVDTDTTGGSWVQLGGPGSTGGNVTTNNSGRSQYKVLTAASHQTFNSSGAMTAGNGAIVAILQAAPLAAPTARTISAAAGTPAQTAVNLTWTADSAANPAPTYLIESSPDGSTGWTTVATGQTGQTGYNVTGLTPGTTSYFRVTGSNSQGSSTSNVAGPITTTTYPKISTAVEQFTALTAWTTVFGTPTINAGQLQLDHVVSPNEAIQSNATYDMTESSVFFKYTAPAIANTGRDFYFEAQFDSSNYVAVKVTRSAVDTIGGYYNEGASQGSFGTSIPYNASTMAYLRLRNAGTIFYVDYSADCSTWTNATSRDFGNLTLANKLKSAIIYISANQLATDPTDPQFSLVDSINVAPLVISQAAYRFYADGTEVASTALAAENTAYTADVSAADLNLLLRTRLQLQTTAATTATDDWQLQWEKNANGTWTNVTTGGTTVAAFDSANLTDGAATTERLGLIDSYDLEGLSELFGSGAQTEKAQSFLGTGVALSGATFKVRNETGATGNAVAKIYAHTGTFGTSGVPTGTPLATSDNVNVATFTTGSSNAFVTFPFSGANRITLTNGTPYFVALAYSGAANIAIGMTNGTGTHPGNGANFASTWVSALADRSFKVIPLSGSGTGSFVAGKVSEDGLVDDLGWTGSNYTEVLYTLTLKQADLTNADTLRFRVLYNGATTSVTYTQTPTINVTKGAGTTTGQPKVYLAGAFTKKPLKVFVGGSWVTKPVKVWTGSTWKTLT